MSTKPDAYQPLIPRACLVPANNFTPSENGSFCHVCAHEVHDLTELRIDQIENYAASKGGGLCIKTETRRAKFTGLQRWKMRKMGRFAAALMLVFGAQLFAFASQAEAEKIHDELLELVQPAKGKRLLKIEAIDQESGIPLYNTRIIVTLGDERYTTLTTDANGKFDLVIPLEQEETDIGFETKSGIKYIAKVVALPMVAQNEPMLVQFAEPEKAEKISRKSKRRSRKNRDSDRYMMGYF